MYVCVFLDLLPESMYLLFPDLFLSVFVFMFCCLFIYLCHIVVHTYIHTSGNVRTWFRVRLLSVASVTISEVNRACTYGFQKDTRRMITVENAQDYEIVGALRIWDS